MSNSRRMAGTRLILRIRRCWSGSSSLTTRTGILSRRGVVITVRHGRLQQRSSPGSPPPDGDDPTIAARLGITVAATPSPVSAQTLSPKNRHCGTATADGHAWGRARICPTSPGSRWSSPRSGIITTGRVKRCWRMGREQAGGTHPPPRGQAGARAYPAAAPAAHRTAGKRALTCICPGGTSRWARDRLSLPR